MGPPYANLGRADAEGNRYYRAYFTADFLWHSALAFEVGKFSLPPRNPYLTPRAMNYYWTYFLLPATAAELVPPSPAGFVDLQRYLKANAILSGLLMMGALFLVVRSAVPSAGPAALAVALAVLAASAEGLYAIIDLVRRGAPLAALSDMNVDAVTAWFFNGLRVDNVPAIALVHASAHHRRRARSGRLVRRDLRRIGGIDGRHRRSRTRARAGDDDEPAARRLLLAGLRRGRRRATPSARAGSGHASRSTPIAAVPVAARRSLGMDEQGDGRRRLGAPGRPLQHRGAQPGHHAGALARANPRPRARRRPPGAACGVDGRSGSRCAGIILGLFLLYFVRISEASWVGFRAGQILLVSIPILLARTLVIAWSAHRPRCSRAVILAIGLPTTVVDTWNAQDIGNRREGPGFRWTLWTTPDQQRAFAWIRANTPATAVVQMEPMVRGREHWTLIPSFAGRRMAAGLPISLLPQPEYLRAVGAREDDLRDDQRQPRRRRRRGACRIDYLYVDATDAQAYPDGVRKFDEHPNALLARVREWGCARLPGRMSRGHQGSRLQAQAAQGSGLGLHYTRNATSDELYRQRKDDTRQRPGCIASRARARRGTRSSSTSPAPCAAARTTTSSSRRSTRTRKTSISSRSSAHPVTSCSSIGSSSAVSCGLQYISPRLRGDLDLLELCRGRGSGLRLADGRQGAYVRGLAGAHREARRAARDTPRHRDRGGRFSCCGDQARLEGRRVRAESLARRVGLEALRRPHPLRQASSSSPTSRRASTSSRSGTSSSTRRTRAR